MNVLQALIENARQDAASLRESHTPAKYEIDREALREARELDMAANLAEHALVSLGLLKTAEPMDDGN